MFKCVTCDYFTDRSNDLKRHNESKKHLINVQKYEIRNTNTTKTHDINKCVDNDENNIIFKCDFCNKLLCNYGSLWRHKKYHCQKKQHNNKDEKIDNMENRIKQLEEQNKKLLDLAAKNADVSGKNADVVIQTV